MPDNSSWFTFNHARIFSDLSILLSLVYQQLAHTENNLSTEACEAGADTNSCAISGSCKTEKAFESTFWRQNLLMHGSSTAITYTSAADIFNTFINS